MALWLYQNGEATKTTLSKVKSGYGSALLVQAKTEQDAIAIGRQWEECEEGDIGDLCEIPLGPKWLYAVTRE